MNNGIKIRVLRKNNNIISALKELDEEGLFGIGDKRKSIIINVEVNPSEKSDTIRERMLNLKGGIVEDWITEA